MIRPFNSSDQYPNASALANESADQTMTSAWDRFLQNSQLGQFQQTSGWAEVKALDGWKRELILLDPNRPESGGLQLLWKLTRIGRIGYVSKGPVLACENLSAIDATLRALTVRAHALRIRALILQPPDCSQITEADLVRHHFYEPPISSVINATAIVELTGGREATLARMNRKARQNARTAIKCGVTVRRAQRDALPGFFELMRESCQRQGVNPNPSRIELLEALWDRFNPHVWLGLASIDQTDIGGLLLIGHGQRVTFWKKGGSEKGNNLHANSLLMIEALGWAADAGYSAADFVGISPEIAKTLLGRGRLTSTQQNSQDVFKLRFGAEPKLLPSAKLLVLNRLLREICRPIINSCSVHSVLTRRLISKHSRKTRNCH